MRTFRLLLWLRWRLALNTTSGRSRWVMAGLTVLMALAFSPIFVGAAIAAFALGARQGAPALLLVFGAAQAGIVWVSLLAGALGRTFELDKLKRYPFRPLDVFAFNTLASFGEPVVLMTVPALAAVALGVAAHDGAAAGFRAAGGAVMLLLITAAALQLLLAVLDDFLRREWMRYAAAVFFTATLLAVNLAIGRSSRRLAEQAQRAGYSPERLLDDLRALCERVPTVAAPASLGGAHVTGPLDATPLAFAVSAAALALPLWLGARVMSRAVTREALAGRVKPRGGRAATGSFAPRWPGLTPPQALLVMREWLYLVRTPAVLYQMASVPLVMVFISLVGRSSSGSDALLPAFVLTSSLAARNLMLWSHDGPGIRTLFLLPFTSRDLVLSKNIAWLGSTFAQVALALAVLTALRPERFLADLPLFVTGFAALAFVAAAVGTWVSMTRPVKPQGRGFSRQSPGGALGLLAYLVVAVMGAAVVLSIMAARALAPDAHDAAASLAVTTLLLAVSAGIWWIAMDRHADELERCREKLIDVLGRTADA